MTTESRTHIRVTRSDGREWPNITIAMRELLGTAEQITPSESQRMRVAIRAGLQPRDRHGFTWRSVGGTVSEQTIQWTDFTFGIELELLAPMSMSDVNVQLAQIGASNWRVVHDGSLTGAPGFTAMEVVSPVLQGVAGMETVVQVMDMLKAKGCKINSSCGMHVHIGVRGMKVSRLRKIAIAFFNAEHHFDAVMPASRRSNRYCQSNVTRARSQGTVGQLSEAGSISALGNILNGGNSSQHYNQYRYYKLNFQSFVRHGTIEFRQHAGTVESEKATAWIRLIAGFCAFAASSEQQVVGGGQMDFDSFLSRCTDEAGVRFMNARRAKFAAQAERAAA